MIFTLDNFRLSIAWFLQTFSVLDLSFPSLWYYISIAFQKCTGFRSYLVTYAHEKLYDLRIHLMYSPCNLQLFDLLVPLSIDSTFSPSNSCIHVVSRPLPIPFPQLCSSRLGSFASVVAWLSIVTLVWRFSRVFVWFLFCVAMFEAWMWGACRYGRGGGLFYIIMSMRITRWKERRECLEVLPSCTSYDL